MAKLPTPTTWNSFNWGAAPWGGTTAKAMPTWTDYITVDGQIIAQRSIQYEEATAWGFQNWGGFNWGRPPGNLWGGFNWGAANWSGPVITWAYFTLDHLGSVAVITDQGGNVVQRLSYDAWGKQRNANGTDASCGAITASTTRSFTNQGQMPIQCLVNFNARIYDPSIGRFMAADSIVPDEWNGQSFNRFSYVRNKPVSLIDPTGNIESVIVTGNAFPSSGMMESGFFRAETMGIGPDDIEWSRNQGGTGAPRALSTVGQQSQMNNQSERNNYLGNSCGRTFNPSGCAGTGTFGNGALIRNTVAGNSSGESSGAASYVRSDVLPQGRGSARLQSSSREIPAWSKDTSIRKEMRRAWEESNPYAPPIRQPLPGSKKLEQGGWVVQWVTGDYDVVRFEPFSRDQTSVGPPPLWCIIVCSTVGIFHTHPNWNSEGYDGYGVSPVDQSVSTRYNVPGVIITHQGLIYVSPNGGN